MRSPRTQETALHYIFSREGKSFFYGCDGAWFLAQTWSVLQKQKLDVMILEATVGEYAGQLPDSQP